MDEEDDDDEADAGVITRKKAHLTDEEEDDDDERSEDEEEEEEVAEPMTGIESGQGGRYVTPPLAIEAREARGDTPTLEIGPDGRPVAKKRKATGASHSQSFNVGFS